MSAKEAGRRQAASGSRPDEEVRSFYRNYHDAIQDKRLDSPYPLRRYVHRAIQEDYTRKRSRVREAGRTHLGRRLRRGFPRSDYATAGA